MNKQVYTGIGSYRARLAKVMSTWSRDQATEISWDEVDRTKISQIFVWHGLKIYAIQFQYVEDGNLGLSKIFGSTDMASKFHSIRLNYPSEQIIGVSGTYDQPDIQNTGELSSLKIVTNLKSYGPYGCLQELEEEYEEFEYEVGMGQFGGFYGVSGSKCIKFIGIYLKPAMTLDALNMIEQPVKAEKVEKEC